MKIALTGSIAFDYLMSFPGHFKEHFLEDKLESISLSFLVDKMVKRRGGIGPNIGYTMALLGGDPVLMSTVGQDFEEFRSWLEDKGVDTVTPRLRPEDASMVRLPWIDAENFNPGYLTRSLHLMPKRGDRDPWVFTQDYWAERDEFPAADLEDGALVYT